MRYRKLYNYKYQLRETFTGITRIPGLAVTEYIVLENNILTLKNGYAWNGVSYMPDTKPLIIASLIHDAIYQLIRLKMVSYDYRKVADKHFRETAIASGMNKGLANTLYRGLRMFGARAAQPGRNLNPSIDFEAY